MVLGRATLIAVAFSLLVPAAGQAKRTVYVTHFNSNNVAALDVAPSGVLTPLAGSPFAAGPITLGEALSPDGKHLYVANGNGSNITAYSVAADGSLAPIAGSPFASPGGATGVAVAPDGKHVYVTNQLSDRVSAYNRAADGSLTPVAGSPFVVGDQPYGVAVSPSGNHVYVGNRNSGSVSAFDVAADGSLTAVAGSPFATAAQTFGLTFSHGGAHLYVATFNGISAYDVAANGSLAAVAGSPFASGAGAVGVAATPDSKHLFVGNSGAASISAYDIAANGSLTAVAGSPFASPPGPIYTAISPDGAHLFVSHASPNGSVSSFALAADGALTPVGGSPFATGGNTPDFQSVTVSPNQPPVASFTAAPLKTGGPVNFDATASTDSDGTIARYDWDFGDGTVLADGGPTPAHEYAVPGSYQTKVTLTDNEGCSTAFSYTGQTALCNGSPVATQAQTIQIIEGIAPQVTIAAPVDGAIYRRGQVVAAAYSCTDESAGSGIGSCVGDVGDGKPFDTSTVGAHTFTVNATDNAGNTAQKKVSYRVVDPPPVIKRLKVAPQSFPSDPIPTPLGKGGAKIKVTLSEDAKVRFRVRHDPARSNGGQEPAPHVFKRQLDKGKNSISFTATLGNRTFTPGDYRLIARARDDAGQPSERVVAKFQITG